MLTIVTALALAAAAQTAPATNPHAQHGQTGQADHSKMGQHGGGCCKQTAEGKMECQTMSGRGAGHQGQAGHQPQQGHGSGR